MHKEYMVHNPFINGNVRVKLFRQLPEGSSNLKCIKKDTLTKATRENLEQIAERYDIFWQECLEYDIIQNNYIRHGYIIKGRTKHNKSVEYWRLETKNISAGQSYVYFGYRKRIRSHVLRNGVPGGIVNTKVELKHQQEWLKFYKGMEVKKTIVKIKEIDLFDDLDCVKYGSTFNGIKIKLDQIINTLNTLVKLENERFK